MTHESGSSTSQPNVPGQVKDTRLVVAESKPFVAFDQWMDMQLELLVARWIHTAAPNASRIGRSRSKFGRH